MSGTQDAEFIHQLAKSYAQEKGISEEKAIREIRDRLTLNSELYMKIPQPQPQTYQDSITRTNSLENTAGLIAKGSARAEELKSGSQASALEMRKLELEERRLDIEQRRDDAEQKSIAQEQEERKDRLALRERELTIKEEQAKRDHQLERESLKIERETTRADQKFTQMLALSQVSGKGSDEVLEMIKNQNDAQRDYFKEINTVKDNERKHTDQLRTDLAKIESDRDVELAKLKASSDQNTSVAIDTLVQKMDENFEGMVKPGGDDEDFLEKYNREIEKVDRFQANLTKAGLKTLESQGVNVEALKKAHNIATESEESTLDKIIGVGKDLYEKTIKPGMEEAAKNGSGSGTNAPSGLETAFETPDTAIEDRIRAEQESQDSITPEDQIKIEEENVALKKEFKQYEVNIYNKALQYGISTHGLPLKDIESVINQYETIMSTPFNSAQQIESIVNLRQLALEFKINTAGKTVGQVDDEVKQAQQRIEEQLDELPDYVPGDKSEPEIEPDQISSIDQHATPDSSPILPIIEPKSESPQETHESMPTEPEPNPEEIIDHNTDPQKPPDKKRTVTAQHSPGLIKKSTKKQDLKKFTTQDGTVVEGKTPLSVASRLAKELGGTKDHPAIVELIDEDGQKFIYETRVDKVKRHGKMIDMARAKKLST